jgi:hypothetical protein
MKGIFILILLNFIRGQHLNKKLNHQEYPLFSYSLDIVIIRTLSNLKIRLWKMIMLLSNLFILIIKITLILKKINHYT